MQKVVFRTAVIGAVAIVASLPFGEKWISLSVALGVMIAIINFWLLQRVVRGFVEGMGSKGWLLFQSLGKFVVLGVTLWWLLTKTSVEPLALLVGLSSILVPLFREGLVQHA